MPFDFIISLIFNNQPALKIEEGAGGWRRLHIVELHKSRRIRWAGHVARMEEMRNAYSILVGKPDS